MKIGNKVYVKNAFSFLRNKQKKRNGLAMTYWNQSVQDALCLWQEFLEAHQQLWLVLEKCHHCANKLLYRQAGMVEKEMPYGEWVLCVDVQAMGEKKSTIVIQHTSSYLPPWYFSKDSKKSAYTRGLLVS